ncbi:methyl-CpG-binding domain protein 3-like 1 [Orycteropus afer afer]|uniref:Methyl-CpG-binding domain protein 3-like 1 n=1 Tax=Orycteropus afer afer TaxID=1230840 RepID=A0AC54ZAF2_ORYAF|nr:methyl-CpG-binding domain protein 3-like 1 [Orycteropus afer afer]
MMTQTSHRKREHEAEVKWKPSLSSKIPLRLTSCIFQRPVNRITSHPGNEVRHSQWEEKLEEPQQVCAYKRLQGLQACSSTGELLNTLDFTNALKIIAPGGPSESLSHVGNGAPCTHCKPIPGPSSNMAEIIPGVGLCLSQTLSGQLVTSGHIRTQTRKVKKARERLAKALRADRLAREAERARGQERRPEN